MDRKIWSFWCMIRASWMPRRPHSADVFAHAAALLSSSMCCTCLAQAFNPMGKARLAEGGIDCGKLHMSLLCLVSSCDWWLILSVDSIACLARTARIKHVFCKNPFLTCQKRCCVMEPRELQLGQVQLVVSWVRTGVKVQAKKHVGGEGGRSHSTASLSDSY